MVPWRDVVWPYVLVWPHAMAFWVLFVITYLPELQLVLRSRHRAAADAGQDRGTFRLLVRLGGSAFWLALGAAILLPTATITSGRAVAFYGGLCATAAGSLLRHHCFRTLGEYFVGTVSVRSDHPIVQRGAYRWVRHPSYAGGILYMTGLGLAFTNWVSLGILAVLPTIGYMIRMRAEEQAFLAAVGEPYRDYMRRTKRLIPWLV